MNEGKAIVESFVKVVRSGARDENGDLPPEVWRSEQVNPTLNSFDMGDTRATTAIVEPTFFQMHQSGDTRIQTGVMHTLAGYMGTGGNNTPMVAQPIGIQGNMIGRADTAGPQGRGYTGDGDPMFTLTSTDVHAVAFTTEQTPKYNEDVALTLTKGSPSGGGQPQAVTTNMAVRRLTPLECERLMGWPDGWTDGQADSHRYRQCGNGVATPVAKWIASHLRPIL